jgi:hypothetical protein
MPVILATQEAEIRRIMVQSQPGQIVHETLSRKYPSQRRAGGVAQGVGPEFKPQYRKQKERERKEKEREGKKKTKRHEKKKKSLWLNKFETQYNSIMIADSLLLYILVYKLSHDHTIALNLLSCSTAEATPPALTHFFCFMPSSLAFLLVYAMLALIHSPTYR